MVLFLFLAHVKQNLLFYCYSNKLFVNCLINQSNKKGHENFMNGANYVGILNTQNNWVLKATLDY